VWFDIFFLPRDWAISLCVYCPTFRNHILSSSSRIRYPLNNWPCAKNNDGTQYRKRRTQTQISQHEIICNLCCVIPSSCETVNDCKINLIWMWSRLCCTGYGWPCFYGNWRKVKNRKCN
jgi:hypothetical protein